MTAIFVTDEAMQVKQPSLTSDRIRRVLQGKTGRSFWRSLDELSRTPSFQAFLDAEFPSPFSLSDEIDRRSMLKVMAASLALAGLSGCSGTADEAALPYVEAPESTIPGKPKWYATAVTLGGLAQPALGKTFVGRPVKLEGNPDHPTTHGATDAFLQAALLDLYDPDRSRTPRQLGRPTSWSAFDAAIGERAVEFNASRGKGLRILTGTTTSPTLARQISNLVERWPEARWHVLEPVADGSQIGSTQRIFGQQLDQHLMLDRTETLVCLDDDVLGPGPRQSMNASQWSTRRLSFQRGDGNCRLFVAESTLSITGSLAEKRLSVEPRRVASLARALAAVLGVGDLQAPPLSSEERRWVDTCGRALRGKPGSGLVSVGRGQAAEVQALGLLINERIGAFGNTLNFTLPITLLPPDGVQSMGALAKDMADGRVTMLAALGVNPVYAGPADLTVAKVMEKVPFRLHAGLHYDETASLSHWHVPLAHELESWSDARTADGTAGIIQPLIRPLHAGRSIHVIVENIAGASVASDIEIVQRSWREAWSERFDERWREALVRGYVVNSAATFVTPSIIDRSISPAKESRADGLTVIFRPDPTIWDGRFANNAWLQETPKPLSKITWGNVLGISQQLASERGIANGDELQLDVDGRSLIGPAWITPGQALETVTVVLGYGRARAGRVGEGLGYDAFAVRSSSAPWQVAGAVLVATGRRQIVATTQMHQAMDGFDFVRTVQWPPAGDPAEVPRPAQHPPSFYAEPTRESPSWGMSIDLDLCIGCNACVVACVAENNVPVVGKELVAQGREMHWLRVDHYQEGDPAQPKSYFQPVPCMHCEQAPCEMGCPVNATVHSSDGLNLQVYNRCIGTRTCSSYCPYKVRRFNWFDYTGGDTDEIRAMRNPDVTVRSRGVMEKCTYCVQRISVARIAAEEEGRSVGDGEIVTACQQACPTRAITFGDITNNKTAVSRKKADARNYSLLPEANTRPRTTYLARIETTSKSEDESG
jgi:molybdopterin-containing oxidoreductase family iron-sulfur binding subunit